MNETGMPKPDMTCVPYRRKGLYLAITLPFMAILAAVLAFLWTFHPLLALAFFGFYATVVVVQSYCCAYQDCPYVGGFCPAVTGIWPANPLAKWLAARTKLRSAILFEVLATIGFVAILGLAFFPLWWLAKASVWLAVAYVVVQLFYYGFFTLAVCPSCAIRNACPGGQVHQFILRQSKEL
jgi:hypothetical protein